MNREETYKDKFISIINDHKSALNKVERDYFSDILKAAKKLLAMQLKNSTVFFCGNGGSASDSEHLAAEFIGRFKKDRPSLKAISLASNISVITCISNDYSFEDVFSRQLSGLAKDNDVLVSISTSGNSENIIRCLETAKKIGVKTISFLGKRGG